MSSRLRVAVVGLGIGSHHARVVAGSGKAELVALCDASTARLEHCGKELAVKTLFNDYKKMLRETRPDAVIVATPNVHHAPITIAALNAGAHVLCEKPMAMNTREALRMADAADRKKRKLMINFSYRFTPAAWALKQIVDSGAVGDVYYAKTRWHRNRGIPGFGGWFGQKKLSGGGPLIDLGVHRIDMAMWLMGDPNPVSVSGSTYNKLGSALARKMKKSFDVEDLAVALIRFDNGATLIAEISWMLNGERNEDMATYLYGTKAGICHRNLGDSYDYEACIFGEIGGVYATSKVKIPVHGPNSVSHFLDVVTEGVKPIVTPQQGINVMKVLDGIYKSAELGREVRL